MKRNWTKQIVFPLLDEKLDGSQSPSSFCQQHGMNKAVYYYWHARWQKARSRKTATPAMVPLKLEGLNDEQTCIVIEYKQATKIHLPVHLLTHLPTIMKGLSDAG